MSPLTAKNPHDKTTVSEVAGDVAPMQNAFAPPNGQAGNLDASAGSVVWTPVLGPQQLPVPLPS